MDTASFIVSVVALCIAGGSLWYSRGEKLTADKAATAAGDSADAAQRSADIAEEAVTYKRGEVERGRIRFELEHSGGSTYILRNRGTDSAYGVQVELGALHGPGGPRTFDEFESDHAETYVLLRAFGSETTHLVVKWHHRPDRSDEVREKRLVVPLRLP